MIVRRVCPNCHGLWSGRHGLRSCQCLPAAAELQLAGPIAHVDLAVSLFPYHGVVQHYVLAAKNGGRRDVLAHLGRNLGSILNRSANALPMGWAPTVAWVPASRIGRRQRGYDQGRLLARAVARELGLPVMPLLARRGREAQGGLPRSRRLAGPGVRCRVGSAPEHVLLVDDVITTGASLAASAAALRHAGTSLVVAAAIAKVDGGRRSDVLKQLPAGLIARGGTNGPNGHR